VLNLKQSVKNNLPFILFMVLLFSFRSSVADWYYVPTGSMEPTIQVGDRVVVDKSAYTLELPFTDVVVAKTGNINRGDIVIIDSNAAETRLIKRVVAIEGDTVIVELEGNCISCSVNQMTLQLGVETTIKKYAPQIKKVVKVN